jgi:hypothetical protein
MSCIQWPITYTPAQINEPPLPAVGWDPTAKMHSAAPPPYIKPAPTLTLSLTPPSRASLSPSDPPERAGPIQGGCAALPVAAGGLPAVPLPPRHWRAPSPPTPVTSPSPLDGAPPPAVSPPLGNPGAPSDPAVRFCRHSAACSLDPPMHQRGAHADRHLQGGSCPVPPPTLPSPLQGATEVFDVLSDRPYPPSCRRRTSWWRR